MVHRQCTMVLFLMGGSDCCGVDAFDVLFEVCFLSLGVVCFVSVCVRCCDFCLICDACK